MATGEGLVSESKRIPANCDMPLSGRGGRRCKWAGIVETEDGRMVCGHHAKMVAEDLVEPDLDSDPG
jgi:hypothetical protein